MTTIIPFTPSDAQSPPFSTTFTLDGASYLGAATWNVAAQRWYFSLYSSSGAITWHGALIGSPNGFDIPLATGLFTQSTILYRAGTGNFEVTP
ncbi:MAG: hypothetical protein B7X71_10600 [Polynucleobacter sp. 39-46-10]|jgi:hypothetical protein|nr:MAG: hypothetical protein B7X71_10600 [Polynucleobacter sp. 39-46-10]